MAKNSNCIMFYKLYAPKVKTIENVMVMMKDDAA